MLEVLRRDGHRMLVRDASHLGFPSCQILVPGMSEVFAPTGDLRKGLLDTIRAKEALRQFPSLGKEEQRELLAIKPHDLAHALPGVFDLPFLGGKMHPCRVCGFLHLTLGEFTEALRLARGARSASCGLRPRSTLRFARRLRTMQRV